MPGHVALYFTLLLTNYPYQSKDDSATRKSKKELLMHIRRVPIPLLAGFVFRGHVFNSTTLCWLPLRLPHKYIAAGRKRKTQKILPVWQ